MNALKPGVSVFDEEHEEYVRLVRRLDLRYDVMGRILAEFDRFPSLALTIGQACRLWRLEVSTCQSLFDVLVDTGVLRLRADGRYAHS